MTAIKAFLLIDAVVPAIRMFRNVPTQYSDCLIMQKCRVLFERIQKPLANVLLC